MRKLLLLLGLSGSLAQAQVANIDSLQQIVRNNKQDLGESIALNTLANEYTRTDMAKARSYSYSSIEIAKRLKEALPLSVAYAVLINIQQNTGHTDSAGWYLQLLQKLADTSTNTQVRGNFHGVAGLFYKHQENYKAALPYMIAAAQDAVDANRLQPTIGNRINVAGQYLNLGNTYIKLGDYRSALSWHLKALHGFEETSNQKGQSFCYQSIASDFLNLNELGPATTYTRKAIGLKALLKDKRGLATATAELGEISLRRQQYDDALRYYLEAIKGFHEMKLSIDEAQADIEIGKIYGLKKEPASAAIFFQNAKLLAQTLKDSSLVTATDAESVAMETDLKKQRQAEDKLMSSLRMSIEQGDKSREVQNYKYLADYYAGNRQFDKALLYTNKLHQVNDSISSHELELQLNRMEKQYNFDKKEQEIELLKKNRLLDQIMLQRQKNIQIAGAVFLALLVLIAFLVVNRHRILNRARRAIEMEKMRNDIARDLHDDIGSMLTSINILSTLMIGQSGADGAATPNLQKIKDRSAAIMESMGDIVWAIHPANDSMQKIVQRMKEFLSEILDPVEIEYTFTGADDLSALELDVKQRKDLYLFFKEAVHNAAKYSRGNRVRVDMRQVDQTLHLEITDDGRGFNPGTVRAGNGLRNLEERARSLGGSFRIESAIDKGTAIGLDIPLTNS